MALTAGSLNGTGTLAAQGDVSQVLAYPGGTATLSMTGAGAQTLTGASTTVSGDLPLFVINKPSGTLTLAGTIRTTHNWTYTAGTVDPGTSTVVFGGGTITGSHTLNAVDFRATTSIAAGTTLTVAASTTLTSGSLNGTGTLAAQGSLSQTVNSTGGTATLLINGPAGQTFTGTATTAGGDLPVLVINKPSGHPDPGRHDPDDPQLDLHRGDARPRRFDRRLLRRDDHRLAHPHLRRRPGDDLDRRRDDADRVGIGQPHERRAQRDRHAGRPGPDQPSLDDHRRDGHPPDQRRRRPDIDRRRDDRRRSAAARRHQQAVGDPDPGRHDPDRDQLDVHRRERSIQGTSSVIFAGGTLSSAGMSFYDVTTNGATTTLGNAMSIGHTLTVAGGTFTTSASNFGLTIGGDVTVAGTFRWNGSAVAIGGNLTDNGTIVPGTSTLTLNGSAGQSIGGATATPAFHLVINDSLGVTLNANLTVSGTLTLTSGQLNVGSRLLTISNAIAGTPTNLVTTSASSLTVTGAGAGISVPTSVSLLGALTLNNANGLSASADLTIGGTLTLTTGRLDAGAATIIVGPGGSVVRTGGWVVGRLEKHANTGTAVGITFEIGDTVRYTPVSIAFGTVTTPGDLTASTTPGDHPDVANSGVAGNRSVNRFWTVTNTGIAFDTYDATFTFAAADLDAGAVTGSFIVAKRDGTTWTRPTVGTRTATTTKATGMTNFSDFEIGQPSADLAVTIDDGQASVTAGDGLTHAYTITVSNGGPSDATPVGLTLGWPAVFSQGAVSPSQGSCAPIGAGPDLTCSLGTIAAGGSATVSVAYTVPAATPGGPASATATVSSPAIDPVAANNSATDATTVVETAVLVVTTDDGLTSVLAGTTGHAYTITVTNSGPSDADSVRLDDVVPAALQRRHAERRYGRRLHGLGRQHDRLQPAGQPRPRCDLDDHRPVRRRQRRPGPDRHQQRDRDERREPGRGQRQRCHRHHDQCRPRRDHRRRPGERDRR